jgi:hypothetical protein
MFVQAIVTVYANLPPTFRACSVQEFCILPCLYSIVNSVIQLKIYFKACIYCMILCLLRPARFRCSNGSLKSSMIAGQVEAIGI